MKFVKLQQDSRIQTVKVESEKVKRPFVVIISLSAQIKLHEITEIQRKIINTTYNPKYICLEYVSICVPVPVSRVV